jgi:hypothetical protein
MKQPTHIPSDLWAVAGKVLEMKGPWREIIAQTILDERQRIIGLVQSGYYIGSADEAKALIEAIKKP